MKSFSLFNQQTMEKAWTDTIKKQEIQIAFSVFVLMMRNFCFLIRTKSEILISWNYLI